MRMRQVTGMNLQFSPEIDEDWDKDDEYRLLTFGME